MKKLMIACAAVALAAAAHAATCNWSGANVTTTGPEGGPTTWSVILMDSAVASQSDLAKLFGGTDKAALAKAISDATVLTAAGMAQGSTAGRWTVTGGALPASYTQGTDVTFYTLILDQGGVQDEGAYFLSQEVSGKVSDSTALNMGFMSQAGKSWTSYNVVPEPTSGLLLLLGVAGLALRRRRA